MREIKFRGKSEETGNWVYGSLIVLADKVLIATPTEINAFTTYVSCRVIRETVGQYTGLKDKNGKEIYEGDIFKAWSQGQCAICEVKWGKGSCRFCLCRERPIDILWNLSGGGPDGDQETVEVIGNVWENPELLGAVE